MKKETKKLYRNKKDKIVGGVCGGIGNYFKVDPNIVRLIWALATILSMGAGILVYILAWIILPARK